jgi:hypothetical protein
MVMYFSVSNKNNSSFLFELFPFINTIFISSLSFKDSIKEKKLWSKEWVVPHKTLCHLTNLPLLFILLFVIIYYCNFNSILSIVAANYNNEINSHNNLLKINHKDFWSLNPENKYRQFVDISICSKPTLLCCNYTIFQICMDSMAF